MRFGWIEWYFLVKNSTKHRRLCGQKRLSLKGHGCALLVACRHDGERKHQCFGQDLCYCTQQIQSSYGNLPTSPAHPAFHIPPGPHQLSQKTPNSYAKCTIHHKVRANRHTCRLLLSGYATPGCTPHVVHSHLHTPHHTS